MSLDFNLTNCDNLATVPKKDGTPGKEWTDATQSIIFATMAADIGHITDANAEDFMFRCVVFYRLIGSPTGPAFTLDDVKQHIGLSTNVFTTTDAKWWTRMREVMKRDRKSAIRWHDEAFLESIGPEWPNLPDEDEDADRNHSHHINGKDERCENLTHCPSFCDCTIDGCTAQLKENAS